MKKTGFMLFCLLFFNTILFAQTDEDFYIVGERDLLEPIDDRFIGVYIPIEFLAALEKTKHYNEAMRTNSSDSFDDFYERILVFRNRIIYWHYFGEGYWSVSKSQFPNYQFEYISDNEAIIIDPNGHKYLKMTNDPKNHISFMSNYIAKIILNDLIENEDVTIENDIISVVSLDNRKFKIGTFGYVYNDNENLVLRDCEHREYYSLTIENNVYTIYWIECNIYTSYEEVKRIIWEKQL